MGIYPYDSVLLWKLKGGKLWKNTMSGAAQVGSWPQQLVRLSGTGKSRGVFMVTPTLAAAWQPAPQRRGRSSSSLHNPCGQTKCLLYAFNQNV